MKKFLLNILSFLYHNYVGWYSLRIFGKLYNSLKAPRIMFPFFVIWGITKIFQSELYFSWIDGIFSFFAIIQYIAGFTNIVKNLYIKYSNENEARIIRNKLRKKAKLS